MYEVVQVIPQQDFSVYVYFSDGVIKKYDAKPLLNKGVFKKIADVSTFTERCTVMNHTLAWDISGNFDPYSCLDIAPDTIYENSITVSDPLLKSKGKTSSNTADGSATLHQNCLRQLHICWERYRQLVAEEVSIIRGLNENNSNHW